MEEETLQYLTDEEGEIRRKIKKIQSNENISKWDNFREHPFRKGKVGILRPILIFLALSNPGCYRSPSRKKENLFERWIWAEHGDGPTHQVGTELPSECRLTESILQHSGEIQRFRRKAVFTLWVEHETTMSLVVLCTFGRTKTFVGHILMRRLNRFTHSVVSGELVLLSISWLPMLED